MKNLHRVSQKAMLGVMLIGIISFNQSVQAGVDGPEKNGTSITQTLVESNTRIIENRAFINWKITGLIKDCMFLIQHSVDQGEFETIEMKKGLGGDASITILYCHIDDDRITGVVKYQVKKLEFHAPKNDNIAFGE